MDLPGGQAQDDAMARFSKGDSSFLGIESRIGPAELRADAGAIRRVQPGR
jgi:hypothetical protein